MYELKVFRDNAFGKKAVDKFNDWLKDNPTVKISDMDVSYVRDIYVLIEKEE